MSKLSDLEKETKELGASESSADLPLSHDVHEKDVEAQKAGPSVEEELGRKRSRIGDAISRTISAVSSTKDIGPPPDGGTVAWTQVALVHLVVMSTWGLVLSFGVFQPYFVDMLDRPSSDVSWFGSMQIWLLFAIGTLSGRATDAGLFRPAFVTGSLLIVLGIMFTSLCTTYWQLFLANGVCIGLGNGLLFCPTVALLSTYFSRRRAMAFGLAASGSATGGLIYPTVVRELLPVIGFAWTIRVLGFITLFVCALGAIFFRTRLEPRKAGPLVEWAAFKELPFVLYCIGAFLIFWSLMFAFFYIVTFAKAVVGITDRDAISLVLAMNGIGAPGRIIPNTIASFYTGPINLMILFSFASGVILFAWAGVESYAGLMVFSIFYGFFSGGIMGLFPATLANLTSDLSKQGTRMGMGFTVVSIAVLTGPPLAGVLIQANNGSYLAAQAWAGTVMICGCFFIAASRIATTGLVLRAKI